MELTKAPKDSLRKRVKTIINFLKPDTRVTAFSRIDHLLLTNEKGFLPQYEVANKLQGLSDFVGFEVRGSDYVVDVAMKLKEKN